MRNPNFRFQRIPSNQFGGVIVEGLLACILLVLVIFGVFDLTSYLNKHQKLSRIIDLSGKTASHLKTCEEQDRLGQRVGFLPDDQLDFLKQEIITVMSEQATQIGLDSNMLEFVSEFYLNESNLENGEPDLTKKGVFLWLGAKFRDKQSIYGIINPLQNCHTLLVPIKVTFSQESTPEPNDDREICPLNDDYEALDWDGYSLEDAIQASVNFCQDS